MRKFNVTVNGKEYSVEVDEIGGTTTTASAPVVSAAPAVAPAPAAKVEKPVAAGGTPVNSPMPGLILSLASSDGATVKKGDKILVLEAMKMENDIYAPADGVITYAVKKGDNVETGAALAYVK